MRRWPRPQLPVLACALSLGVVLTGSAAAPGGAGHFAPTITRVSAAAARVRAALDAAGVSSVVGPIPGVAGRAASHRSGGASIVTAAAFRIDPLPRPPLSPAEASAAAVPEPTLLRQADVLVVSPTALSRALVKRISRMRGVAAALPVDAGRIRVNGVFVNVLGVSIQAFRPFAARPTARSTALWQNVAAGGMAVSYTMGQQDRLSLTKPVTVAGSTTKRLPVAGFGTVGIGGVDAVVSHKVARSLGMQSGNAIVISAPKANLAKLIAKIRRRLPAQVAVAPLVAQTIIGGTTVTADSAGALGVSANQGGLTAVQLTRFLAAARSRIGLPYVWGAAGPRAFDCSGLVQWSLAQAGVVMPRVAADQARTGPLVPLSQLQPGDLLFYHTDPTAPDYISHVAIYIGNGLMLQAPEPGMDVQIVAADFGAGFAGAIRVDPRIAADVAANAAG